MVERVELKTERLLLRQFRFTDVPDVLAYAGDEEWARFLPVPQPYTVRHGEEFVAGCVLASWETRAEFALVFEGRVVGAVALRVNEEHKRGEMGYAIGKEHWGKGITPEAAAAVLEWGFVTRDLNKIYAYADERNVRSQRVMEKLGMKREGLLRAHHLHGDERCDEAWYGLLREEWEARRAA